MFNQFPSINFKVAGAGEKTFFDNDMIIPALTSPMQGNWNYSVIARRSTQEPSPVKVINY